MLSRVADSLYWMSRYIERAENIARILDVNLQHMLDLPVRDQKASQSIWAPVLRSTGDEERFYKEYRVAANAKVLQFLTLNRRNHNSIINCITSARENGRHVREQISDEMWEELNRFYLDLYRMGSRTISRTAAADFLQSVVEFSQLFQGTTDATMSHGLGWDFIQIGKFIERADKTTRILDANAYVLRHSEGDAIQADNPLRLVAILRSCSGHTAYRRVYVADVEVPKVVEFLVLNEAFPRSVRFCVRALESSLHRISGTRTERFSNEAEKLAGRVNAVLTYSAIDDITATGLHETMENVQDSLNAIGNEIGLTFMGYKPPDPVAEAKETKPAKARVKKKPTLVKRGAATRAKA